MSKKIILNLDFGIDREKDKEALSNQQIAANYIQHAVAAAHREGLNADKRRIWNMIHAKLMDVIKDNKEDMEANEYEMVFLKQAFQTALIPANESKFFTIVEDAILEAK